MKAQMQFIADKLTIGNSEGEWRYVLSNGVDEVQTIYKKDDITIFHQDGKEIGVFVGWLRLGFLLVSLGLVLLVGCYLYSLVQR